MFIKDAFSNLKRSSIAIGGKRPLRSSSHSIAISRNQIDEKVNISVTEFNALMMALEHKTSEIVAITARNKILEDRIKELSKVLNATSKTATANVTILATACKEKDDTIDSLEATLESAKKKISILEALSAHLDVSGRAVSSLTSRLKVTSEVSCNMARDLDRNREEWEVIYFVPALESAAKPCNTTHNKAPQAFETISEAVHENTVKASCAPAESCGEPEQPCSYSPPQDSLATPSLASDDGSSTSGFPTTNALSFPSPPGFAPACSPGLALYNTSSLGVSQDCSALDLDASPPEYSKSFLATHDASGHSLRYN